MCSQVDSLTGENRPAIGLLPVQPYTKCSRVPVMATNTAPQIKRAVQ